VIPFVLSISKKGKLTGLKLTEHWRTNLAIVLCLDRELGNVAQRLGYLVRDQEQSEPQQGFRSHLGLQSIQCDASGLAIVL